MLNVPDELDLLNFFECEPIDSVPEDGFYCYKLTDNRGVDLYFSFHEIEASVQVRLVLKGQELALFSEEYASQITVEKSVTGEYLACLFKIGEVAKSKAEVYIYPEIKVRWYTLQSH